MDVKSCLTEYLRSEKGQRRNEACFFLGCTQLYKVLESGEEKRMLCTSLEKIAAECGSGILEMECFKPGRTWFLLYDETGKNCYRENIEAYMERLKAYPRTEEGIFCREGGCFEPLSWELLSGIYPFYMEYETRFHSKAQYFDIVSQLKKIKPAGAVWRAETVWYLMTVIEVMDAMSKEIFEHYKSLERIFKQTVRTILDHKWEMNFGLMESAMLGGTIVKACNMGVLNSEKYAEIGLSMMDGVVDCPLNQEDSVMLGIAVMDYAQRCLYEQIFGVYEK